jgi:hypothetical protein
MRLLHYVRTMRTSALLFTGMSKEGVVGWAKTMCRKNGDFRVGDFVSSIDPAIVSWRSGQIVRIKDPSSNDPNAQKPSKWEVESLCDVEDGVVVSTESLSHVRPGLWNARSVARLTLGCDDAFYGTAEILFEGVDYSENESETKIDTSDMPNLVMRGDDAAV